MRLTSIVAIANGAYPEGWIFPNWDAGCEEPTRQPVEDVVAWCVVKELQRTFDPTAPDKRQLAQAANAVGRAIRNLRRVEAAFESAYVDAAVEDWSRRERGAAA